MGYKDDYIFEHEFDYSYDDEDEDPAYLYGSSSPDELDVELEMRFQYREKQRISKLHSGKRYDFYTKVVGVTYENRQTYVKKCYVGQELDLIRERFNTYDKNAIAVYAGNHQVGFLSCELAGKLAPKMDSGLKLICHVETVTGGGTGNNYGLNIRISEK